MSENKINSKNYWDERFEKNWDEFGGKQQTEFFANIACELLPEWFIRNIRAYQYTICDMGCALGNAVDVLSKFFSVNVTGIDFSVEAIKQAKDTFPQYNFLTGDITNLEDNLHYDIVFCSNVLEHFYNPWDIFKNLEKISKHYIVLLVPYKEKLKIEEHVYKFDTNLIPMEIDDFKLIYLDTKDGEEIENSYYPDQQVLLIYSNNIDDKRLTYLKDITDGIIKSAIKEPLAKLSIFEDKTINLLKQITDMETEKNDTIKILTNQIETYEVSEENFQNQLIRYLENEKVFTEQIEEYYNHISRHTASEIIFKEEIVKCKKELDKYVLIESDLQEKLNDYQEKCNDYEEKCNDYEEKCNDYEEKCRNFEIKCNNYQEEYSDYLEKHKEYQTKLDEFNKNEDYLHKQICTQKMVNEKNLEIIQTLEKELKDIKCSLSERENTIYKAISQCKLMLSSRLFKMVHMLNRFFYQGIKGKKIERKKFRKWFVSSVRGGGDADHRFNPLFTVINILESKNKTTSIDQKNSNNNLYVELDTDNELNRHLITEDTRLQNATNNQKTVDTIKIEEIIKNRKYKGILIYPHVVYWEPLQTPQQLLRAFAKQGWLCFFCEHPSIKNCYKEIETNLIITYETDLLMALGETPVTILLTWLGSLSFVNKIKNKKVWYHILDKLDIFPYFDDYYMRLHNDVVSKASFVSYVAKPLLECINNKEKAIYLPNGTNPEELLNQHEGFVPDDMKDIISKGHKIIGYYGYLAEWMDYDVIAEVAKARPDYEFVFIGKAIHDTSMIDNLSNVHLLGLKPYNKLSDYAKLFDVATIPFLVNDMMDCVSPIKFYEYCSLGLPVITSRMKEVEAFVCDYIACFNNKYEYLFYLDKYVSDNNAKLLASKYAPQIAENNTWLARANKMINKIDTEQNVILQNDYSKYDVIILSVIDYDFRYQRPQHFASRFANNGHRVFYINANHYKENEVINIDENLYIINFNNSEFSAIHITDWKDQIEKLHVLFDELLYNYCIRDAITIVDYPNWLYGAEYLRTKYGFKIVTDYMDDFTGFLNPAEKLVGENCVALLETSDMVIASSQFLYDIAKKYNSNINIIRNGTEFLHFNKALKCSDIRKRKVIGYYGAVAHWFDLNKVCYVAEQLPECDIVLIGEVSEGLQKLKKYSNIQLLGEMPYDNLPKHLEYFDVCLIPFDTSTDLIKATNPVKFYEYLSAGKKVVATEIPELESFRNKYVYMANDNKIFLNYIKLCLNGSDTLASEEECLIFAKENDWQARYEKFASLCESTIPKISIIVLTYNNLKLNKLCIDSILNKTAYPNYELIIVDNMSTDGTREYLSDLNMKEIPKVKVILNNSNTGFAGGNNIGIKEASGDYVLLLNNDTIVTRGWLTSLVKHMENNDNLGMCGPVTNSIGNEAKIRVIYNSLDEINAFAYRYNLEHIGELYKKPIMLALFCTMIRREVIEKCGLLDETFGVGMFEDDDYSETVKQAGYTLAIAEDSFIHHFEGASFKKLEDQKFRNIFDENKKNYEKKWKKTWKAQGFRDGVMWNTNMDNDIL